MCMCVCVCVYNVCYTIVPFLFLKCCFSNFDGETSDDEGGLDRIDERRESDILRPFQLSIIILVSSFIIICKMLHTIIN